MDNDYSRVISNQVRFGFGYRVFKGRKLYYAWNGLPNRNDDYITITKITEEEFNQIENDYPKEIIADRETMEIFSNKYIENHKVIIEGWNVSIYNVDIKEDIEKLKEKALKIVQEKNPEIKSIPDLFGIDENGEYYHMVWDYPGKYYKQHLNMKNQEEFIRYMVRETIEEKRSKK